MMKKLEIKEGKKIVTVTPLEDSYTYQGVGEIETLILSFEVPNHVELNVGAEVVVEGVRYTLMRPQDLTMYHTQHYSYRATFYGDGERTRLYKVQNQIDGRLEFTLTAKPHEHLQMLVDIMNARDKEGGWKVGSVPERAEVMIPYNHTTVLGGLQQLADKLETEWSIDEKTLHIGKLDGGTEEPLALKYGEGNGIRPEVKRLASEEYPVRRVYVQTGERNIDPAKYGGKRLHLPKSVSTAEYSTDDKGTYVELNGTSGCYRDESVDLKHIYPMREGVVSSVVVTEKGQVDFADSSIPEDLDYSKYQIPDEVMKVVFQSGMLAGRDGFEVHKYLHTSRTFQLVQREEDGITMPSGSFLPKVGDKYAVFGCALPDEYIRKAEEKLLEEALKVLHEERDDKFEIRAEIDGIWASKKWGEVAHKLKVGKSVLFSDPEWLPEPTKIRIVGVKRYLSRPFSPEVELANSVSSGSFSSLIRKVEGEQVIRREETRQSLIKLQDRTYKDTEAVREMVEKLKVDGFSKSLKPETLQTMYAVIGSPALQFEFVGGGFSWTEGKGGAVTIPRQTIRQRVAGTTLEPNPKTVETTIPALTYTLKPDEQQAHIYVELKPAPRYVVSTKPLEITTDRLLVGLLNGEEGSRDFTPLYGFTEISPSHIATRYIRSRSGNMLIDLETGDIYSNKITFKRPDGSNKDIDQVIGESVQVGGRNLILKSDRKFSGEADPVATYELANLDDIKEGDTYHIKIWGDKEDSDGVIRVYNNYHPQLALVELVNGVAEATFKWSNYIKDGKPRVGPLNLFREGSYKGGSSMTIHKVKLERGTVATDWSPAPEDVQAEIDKYKKLVQKVDVEFAVNKSEVAAPAMNASVWQTDAPTTLEVGDCLWQRQKSTLADGSTTYSGVRCVYVAGSGGAVEVRLYAKKIDVEFAVSDSAEVVPINGWVTLAPTPLKSGQYLWYRTKVEWADGSQTTAGVGVVKGGKVSVGVKSLSIEWAEGSKDTAPTAGWQSSPVTPQGSNHLWMRAITELTTGEKSVVNCGSVAGSVVTEAREPKSVSVEYAPSDSTAMPTAGWTKNAPLNGGAKYVHARAVTELTNGERELYDLGSVEGSREVMASPKIVKLRYQYSSSANDYEWADCPVDSEGYCRHSNINTYVEALFVRAIVYFDDGSEQVMNRFKFYFGNDGAFSSLYIFFDAAHKDAGYPLEQEDGESVDGRVKPGQLYGNGKPDWHGNFPMDDELALGFYVSLRAENDVTTIKAYYGGFQAVNVPPPTMRTQALGHLRPYFKLTDTKAAPTSPLGWSQTVPQWSTGKYIYAKMEYGYSTDGRIDGSTEAKLVTAGEYRGAVNRSITSKGVEYYLSTSKSRQEGGKWQAEKPSWVDGKFIFARVKASYSDGTVKQTTPTLVTDSYEARRASVVSAIEEYYDSESDKALKGGSWVQTAPKIRKERHIYTRVLAKLSDSTKQQSEVVCANPKRNVNPNGGGNSGGSGGDGSGIKSIQELYYLSTSYTELVGGQWQDAAPTANKGQYIWTRLLFVYTSGLKYFTDPVCATGIEGKDGVDGKDAVPPRIAANGNWEFWNGSKWVDSNRSSKGDDGHAPKIVDGYWWEWDASKGKYTNTGIRAEGHDGKDAIPPRIASNGNWEFWDGTKWVDSGRTSRGDDGHAPKIIVGYWYEWDNENQRYTTTGIKAQGEDGKSAGDYLGQATAIDNAPTNNYFAGGGWKTAKEGDYVELIEDSNGYKGGEFYIFIRGAWEVYNVKGAKGEPGKDAVPPRIGANGNWEFWDGSKWVDSNRSSKGDDGHAPKIVDGYWWEWDASKGKYTNTGIRAEGHDGKDAIPPRIASNGNWEFWDGTKWVDSGRTSRGDDGHAPKIVDGYWYEWDSSKGQYTNTDIKARGIDGKDAVRVRENLMRYSDVAKAWTWYPSVTQGRFKLKTDGGVVTLTGGDKCTDDYNAGGGRYAFSVLHNFSLDDYTDPEAMFVYSAKIKLVAGEAKLVQFGNDTSIEKSFTPSEPKMTEGNLLSVYCIKKKKQQGIAIGFSLYLKTDSIVEIYDIKIERVEEGEDPKPTAYIPHPDDLKGKDADPKEVQEIKRGLTNTNTLISTLNKAQAQLEQGLIDKTDTKDIQYLLDSLKKGKTQVAGGLVLTNDIILSEPTTGQVTATISGTANTGANALRLGIQYPDNVALATLLDSGKVKFGADVTTDEQREQSLLKQGYSVVLKTPNIRNWIVRSTVATGELTALRNDGTGHIGQLHFDSDRIVVAPIEDISKAFMEFGRNVMKQTIQEVLRSNAVNFSTTLPDVRVVRRQMYPYTFEVLNDNTSVTIDMDLVIYPGKRDRYESEFMSVRLDRERSMSNRVFVDSFSGGPDNKTKSIHKTVILGKGTYVLTFYTSYFEGGAKNIKVSQKYSTSYRQTSFSDRGMRIYGGGNSFVDFNHDHPEGATFATIGGGLKVDYIDTPGVPLCGVMVRSSGAIVKSFGRYKNKWGTGQPQVDYDYSTKRYTVHHSIPHDHYIPTIQVTGYSGNNGSWSLAPRVFNISSYSFEVAIITNGDNYTQNGFSYTCFLTE